MVSYIYILQRSTWLHVGKSDNPAKRFTQHKNGRGSAWTRLHKPIRMVKKRKMTSTLQEDQITEEWMKKGYCQIELPDQVSKILSLTKFYHSLNYSKKLYFFSFIFLVLFLVLVFVWSL
tara:strand:- start:350 stop:706 length:357 start_codon:yes stop_codon:yes gene_type:complete